MEKKYVYKIYTFNDDVDQEIIGYFTSLDVCKYVMEHNSGDIQDAWYHYAAIVELPIGVYSYVGECIHHYYQWDSENEKWNELPGEPDIGYHDVDDIINAIKEYHHKPWIDPGEYHGAIIYGPQQEEQNEKENEENNEERNKEQNEKTADQQA